MILSLQGCMAVGKTTVARYLEQHCQQVQVCFEDNAAVLAEIKRHGLNKNSYADYLEIQRLFLRNELRRGQKAKKYPHAVMDFGAEEIEFYTLNYPKSRGAGVGDGSDPAGFSPGACSGAGLYAGAHSVSGRFRSRPACP